MVVSKTDQKNSHFKKFVSFKYTLLGGAALGLIFLISGNATQAGFQWVPPSGQAQKERAEVPVIREPAMPTPPVVRTIEAPPAPEPIMKSTETMMEPKAEAMKTIEVIPEEPVIMEMSEPSDPLAPMPITKTIVPADAPQKAVAQTENAQRLSIEAFPAQENLKDMPVDHNLRKIVTPQPHSNKVMQDVVQNREPQPGTLMPYSEDDAPKNTGPGVPVTNTPAQEFAIAQGFGSNMPLGFALSQIVPSGFSYSFGESVNPGARVSWEGGQPWNEVIIEMVAPLGLNAQVIGNRIHVHNPDFQSSRSVAPSAPPAQAPMQKTEDTSKTRIISNAPDVLKRARIMDPGQSENIQPEVKSKVENIAPTQPLKTSDFAAPERTEPASGYVETFEIKDKKENQEVISWNKNAALLDNISNSEEVKEPGPINLLETASLESTTQDSFIEAPSAPIDLWEARSGDSLRTTLEEWTRHADINLVWNASHDYEVNSNIFVTGDFKEALRAILKDSLATSGKKPSITYADKANGQASLTVNSSDS